MEEWITSNDYPLIAIQWTMYVENTVSIFHKYENPYHHILMSSERKYRSPSMVCVNLQSIPVFGCIQFFVTHNFCGVPHFLTFISW